MRFYLAAALLATIATPALADRAPDAAERGKLETALHHAGFTSWEEIELDDDGPLWEVDDARTANAKDGRVDLKLDPRTLKIVKRERDD